MTVLPNPMITAEHQYHHACVPFHHPTQHIHADTSIPHAIVKRSHGGPLGSPSSESNISISDVTTVIPSAFPPPAL